MPSKLIIGAHVSTAPPRAGQARGLTNAITNAQAIGADAMQIFGASPRQWRVAQRSAEEVAAFKAAAKTAGLGPTVLHAPYLINLASPNPELRIKSLKLLTEHFTIAEAVGALGLIFHIGSPKGADASEARTWVVGAMQGAIAAVPGISKIIVENSAGGGEKIGRSLAEIGEIIAAVGSPRAAFCFDTAHAFEAGMVPAYTPEVVTKLADDIHSAIGWDRLAALHANDSKTLWNSGNDRHENIGKGYIGLDGFRALVHSRFAEVPWYLEVPGFAGTGPDRENIQALRDLL